MALAGRTEVAATAAGMEVAVKAAVETAVVTEAATAVAMAAVTAVEKEVAMAVAMEVEMEEDVAVARGAVVKAEAMVVAATAPQKATLPKQRNLLRWIR